MVRYAFTKKSELQEMGSKLHIVSNDNKALCNSKLDLGLIHIYYSDEILDGDVCKSCNKIFVNKIELIERERIKKIQDQLKTIRIPPEVIQQGHEITRELSKISVERLYKPFDI